MPKIDYKTLRKKIDQKDISTVYFFYGEEKYLLKNCLNKLIKTVKPESFQQLNFNEFTNENTVDEIADAVISLPFMAEYKCVLVNDFNIESKNATENSKILEMLEDVPESTVLIFSLPTLNIDLKKSAKWRNFLKIVDKKNISVVFEAQMNSDLSKFVTKICEQHGSSISRANASKIIEYAGTDMTNLKNETEKLSAFAKDREITADDIEKLVVKNLDTTVFILIKAIVANNYSRAYSLLNLLFENKEEPVPILARITETYIDLYRVRTALQSGKTAKAPAEYENYKGREFRLTNAERDIRNLPTENLRESLSLLLKTDIMLKSSKISGKIILEELIAKLLIMNKRQQN
ncbi:MAG: DNA polymerase III subunit delta [Clostridia bacterium]